MTEQDYRNSIIVYKKIQDYLNDKFKLNKKIIKDLMIEVWNSYNSNYYTISFDSLNNLIFDNKLTEEILNYYISKNYIHKIYQLNCSKCNNAKEVLCNCEGEPNLFIGECSHLFEIPENIEPVYKVNYRYIE